jgi:hypothetical protein
MMRNPVKCRGAIFVCNNREGFAGSSKLLYAASGDLGITDSAWGLLFVFLRRRHRPRG